MHRISEDQRLNHLKTGVGYSEEQEWTKKY